MLGFAARVLSPGGCCAWRHTLVFTAPVGGHMPCAHPHISNSATGNFAASPQNEMEPIVVSFTVSHMVLHKNWELTGTVSFYCEQQRH